MTLTIRPAAFTEAATLTRAMLEELVALYGPEEASGTLDAEEFTPPRGAFVVAHDAGDDRLVGCAGFRRVGDTGDTVGTGAEGDGERLGQVQRVYVDPAARGRGISRLLMAEVERLAVAHGCTTLRLETGVRQPAAIRLYESLGYRRIPCFPPYENEPLSVCYAKRIG